MNFLVDTCAISELVRPNPDKNVLKWFESADEHSLFLSVITVGEIKNGISKLPASKRKEVLSNWLENDLKKRFDGRILKIDTSISIRWGAMLGEAESEGRLLSAIDALIAATALENNLKIVTRNSEDFSGTGAAIVNPWGGC